MAFTSRAERNTLAKELASTPATVGPGSYGAYFNQVCCLLPPPSFSILSTSSGFLHILTNMKSANLCRKWAMLTRHFQVRQTAI